jgi:lysophospholipase L1-like esterase
VEAPKQPKRSVLIAARLISVIIGLAGAEGILWFGGYPSWWQTLQISRDDSEYAPDPQLGWKNREGQFDMVDSQRNNPFHYTNWSQGRRATADREPAYDGTHATEKPRVLFFGDSYVQGYGLSNQQTFAWMVQKHHPELTISNFGTADYGTYQSYLALAKVVRGPCSVFYLFNSFHEGRNVAEPDWVRVVKPPPPGLFFPYAELEGGMLRAQQSGGEMVWPVSRWLRTAALAQEYYWRLESYSRVRNKRAVTQALLAKMNETVLAAGGRFTVILFDMTPEERHEYREFAQSHGIPFVDCDHPEMKDKRLHLPDGHPNEELNRLLAEWIEPLPLAIGGAHERAGKL